MDGLGDKIKPVMTLLYESADPTIDLADVASSRLRRRYVLQHHHAEIRGHGDQKAAEIGWKPMHFLNNVSASVGSVLKPAGFRERAGHHLDRVSEGPDRRAVEERSGLQEVGSFRRQVHARRQQGRRQPRLRLQRDAGPGASSRTAATISRART